MARQNTGQAPYGFRWEDDRLVPHPEEAATRLRMFELFADNPNKGAVARALTDEGHQTRRGGRWTDMAVGRLLACRSAQGLYAVNKTTAGEDGKRVALPESEWEWVLCERIVPEALCERVQSFLGGADSPPPVARASVVHPFAGVLFCTCGERMRVPSNSPKYVCSGSCTTKIPEDDLEQIFQDELEEFLRGREELLGRFVANPASAATHGEATRLRAEIVRAEETVQKFTELYTKGIISGERFGLLHQPQEQKLGELKRALAELDSSPPDGVPPPKITAPDFVRHWLEFTPKTRRGIIDALVEKIVIGDGEIAINYRFGDSNPLEVASAQQTGSPTNGRQRAFTSDAPEYIRLPKPGERCPRTGLSRSKLNELILPNERNGNRPPVASKSVRAVGSTRGVRLILLESLMAYLDAQV